MNQRAVRLALSLMACTLLVACAPPARTLVTLAPPGEMQAVSEASKGS